MDYEVVVNELKKEIKYFLNDKNAIIGISGGIDSAAVAALCVEAVGKDRVIGIQMPYGNQSTEDGTILMKHLDIDFGDNSVINIKLIVDVFSEELTMIENTKLTNGNIRARVRMSLLYAIAGGSNGMVMGTGNKTEILLGYFTKYGDGGVDVEVIGNLYKTEIFELARYMKLPECIINKAPSAELWEGQTDENEIGMTYKEMDGILRGIEFIDEYGVDISDELISKYGKEKIDILLKKVKDSKHKREMPKSLIIKK
jgi:NAD+ synthase